MGKFIEKQNKYTWVILGMLKNKDLFEFLIQIEKFISGVIAIKIPGEKNSFTTQEIFNNCKKLKIKCVKQKNIKSANQFLSQSVKPEIIIVTGSLYLVGKVRKLFI